MNGSTKAAVLSGAAMLCLVLGGVIHSPHGDLARVRRRPGRGSSDADLRGRAKGIALAEAADGRCTVCQMTIRPQVMQELRQGLEALIFCESCKRILYYNPPVNVEEQMV